MECRVPSMILQPLVENAVNHGIRNIDWEGKILLEITGLEDNILIRVKDNGKGMSEERIRKFWTDVWKIRENSLILQAWE